MPKIKKKIKLDGVESLDDYSAIILGQQIYSEKGWIKIRPEFVSNISVDAAFIFSLAHNVETYLLEKRIDILKSKNFCFVFDNSYITAKTNYSPYQIRTGLIQLEKCDFIKIMPSDFRNKRVIKLNWKKVIKQMIEWKKELIEEKTSDIDAEIIDFMNGNNEV